MIRLHSDHQVLLLQGRRHRGAVNAEDRKKQGRYQCSTRRHRNNRHEDASQHVAALPACTDAEQFLFQLFSGWRVLQQLFGLFAAFAAAGGFGLRGFVAADKFVLRGPSLRGPVAADRFIRHYLCVGFTVRGGIICIPGELILRVCVRGTAMRGFSFRCYFVPGRIVCEAAPGSCYIPDRVIACFRLCVGVIPRYAI